MSVSGLFRGRNSPLRRRPAAGALRGYAICCEPRSGSNLLCSVLDSTGLLGHPTEYFNGPTRRRRGLAGYPDDPEAQLEKVLDLGATPNGVYGLKIFTYQFDEVRGTRWAERLPRLAFVNLIREDVVGQAISLVRALQTGQWSHADPIDGREVYDFDRIDAELKRIIHSRERWSYYLGRNGLATLHLTYEAVVRSPQRAAEAVADLVGLDERAIVDMSKVNLERQSDAVSDEWRARFISRARDLRRFD